MQSPSSLIFLVLLGVWAAYFVQYWVRRRDHVATARSVEQFSEAMRVLERRDPLPRTDLSEPAPRSYAVHPARAARPQVLVKRAVAFEPGPIGVTERIGDVPWAASPSVVSPAARPVRPAAPAAARRRVRPSRRTRGLLLLAALAGLLVITPLVALSVLPLWALALGVLAVGCALGFVRAGVRAEEALLQADRRRRAGLERRRAAAPVTTRSATAARPARATASEAVAVTTVDEPVRDAAAEVASAEVVPSVTVAEPAPAAQPVAAEPVVAEVSVPEPADDVMVPIVDEDDVPLTWEPVPVPRPTYTMKAKAERPEVAPAAVTPDPAPVLRESDERDYDERRVAGA